MCLYTRVYVHVYVYVSVHVLREYVFVCTCVWGEVDQGAQVAGMKSPDVDWRKCTYTLRLDDHVKGGSPSVV